ncbi:MAG: adenylyl-sulfate kinase, partial [Candidatus Woesearchaeota archaeon]|nr:adenylyl-sulfate kinase [Candidatus Woesearchaeota archaeon]
IVEKIDKRIDSATLEIKEINSSVLKETEIGKIIIKTKKPIVFENFNNIEELGRFVLIKDSDVCAGGIIT